MYLFIIVGLLSIGILAAAIGFELYKSAREKNSLSTMSASGNVSPRDIARRKVREVRMGEFLMHTLINDDTPFDDDAYLEKYRSDIQDPAMINYIQSVEGEPEHA